MISTRDLEEFLDLGLYNLDFFNKEVDKKFKEYKAEIIKRLRAYDRICHDLEQLIATLSNVVDEEA